MVCVLWSVFQTTWQLSVAYTSLSHISKPNPSFWGVQPIGLLFELTVAPRRVKRVAGETFNTKAFLVILALYFVSYSECEERGPWSFNMRCEMQLLLFDCVSANSAINLPKTRASPIRDVVCTKYTFREDTKIPNWKRHQHRVQCVCRRRDEILLITRRHATQQKEIYICLMVFSRMNGKSTHACDNRHLINMKWIVTDTKNCLYCTKSEVIGNEMMPAVSS